MSETSTTERIELIRLLLDNYVDVEEGLRDRRGADGVIGMCAAWNHPSYRQLDSLLGLMKGEQWHMYWHVAETYFRATHRRVLQCPRCKGVMPTWHSQNFHKHGHANVAVAPAVVRVIREDVDHALVAMGLAWLEDRWQGGVFLPNELAHLAA